jgi:hypothetical protein
MLLLEPLSALARLSILRLEVHLTDAHQRRRTVDVRE